MLKIVLTYERTILHALLVYDIAPERELPDNIGTPLAELCGTDGVDSIAHGDDGIEVIEQRVAPNLSCTFLLTTEIFSVVASLFNSFVSYIFFRCKPMLSAEQSKSTAMAFCVAHTVSSLYSTCMPCSLPSATKVRNSAVLFRISNFFAIIIYIPLRSYY